MSASIHIPFEVIGGKAAATELENGALLIRGVAANFDLDRELEAFAPSAFGRGLAKFLEGNAPLCHHHDFKTVVGRVLKAEKVAGKGLVVEAVVDPQPEGSPHRWIYEAIKRGRINALSFGGIFRRAVIDGITRIVDADFLELSVCAIPVGKGTTFDVIAGKALYAPHGKAISADGHVIDAAELLSEATALRAEATKALEDEMRKITFERGRNRDDFAREIAEDRERSAQRRDHVETETFEVPASALLGSAPRDKTGAVDQRKARDGWTFEQLADDLHGDVTFVQPAEMQAVFGLDPTPVVPAGPTPEQVFRRQAEDSRLDRIRDKLRKLDGGDDR